jgi:hypothetical protein
MIASHAFNSKWWGAPVGVTSSFEALASSPVAMRAAATPYEWVEARVPVSDLPAEWTGPSNGFTWVDLQLGYRVALKRVESLPSTWSVAAADHRPIDLDDFADFAAERYSRIPGATPARLAQRYRMWATELIAASPHACATVLRGDEVAGYVLGSLEGTKASFTLAVASRTSTAHGLGIYLGAAALYRGLGATSMHAALSASNLPALNAHVALGCLFVSATGIWLRYSESLEQSESTRSL